jgi:hypothetical protein
MHTSNTIRIDGDAARIYPLIYRLAADIQDWPALLPHYRYLRIVEQSATHKIADFGAFRLFSLFASREKRSGCPDRAAGGVKFPVRWRARQDLFPEEGRITYRHVRGITRGMWVEWRLERREDHVQVTIDHDLTYPVPLLGPLFARYIVGALFVSNIAGKTLGCIKAKVEGA